MLGLWGHAFDPFPFIFLNLVLSTLAAVQAPVIFMSQNRQAAEHDCRVNLRAELEIMRLHDRLQLSQAQLARIEGALAAPGDRPREGDDQRASSPIRRIRARLRLRLASDRVSTAPMIVSLTGPMPTMARMFRFRLRSECAK